MTIKRKRSEEGNGKGRYCAVQKFLRISAGVYIILNSTLNSPC